MKKIILYLSLILITIPAYAGPGSVLGGKPMSTPTAHYVGLGWPSLSYEWWHAGNPDWAIGGELVYGDWSGNFSDVDIGFAMNVPLRWHLSQEGKVDVGFLLTPGALIGSINAPGDDLFVLGIRGQMGVPITIDLDNRFNLITGVVVPFTVLFVEHADDFVIIPILPRIGIEFEASRSITPFLLMELGPTIAIGGGDTNVELGIRASMGAVFW
jgi:hypothetical protein